MQTSTNVIHKTCSCQQRALSTPRWDISLWGLVLITLAMAIFQGVSTSLNSNPLVMIVMLTANVAFAIIHGIRRYGLKDILVLFLFVAVLSMFWENLSIYTGFPFGHYHYTDSMGPKFLVVPYLVSVNYFYLVYLAWNMANVLLRRYSNRISAKWVVVLPVIATFIVVMFDMTLDPFSSTATGTYIWLNGGALFGVPFENYMGWYLCTYTMFQSFALYLWNKTQRISIETDERPAIFKKSFWLQNIIIYSAFLIEFLIKGFRVNPTATVTSLDGMTWKISSLVQSAGLIGLSTMGFITLMAFIQVIILNEVPINERGTNLIKTTKSSAMLPNQIQ